MAVVPAVSAVLLHPSIAIQAVSYEYFTKSSIHSSLTRH
jgi:hypothetical protein